MAIVAQDLDRRIVIQRLSVTGKNELNEDIKTWLEFRKVWASRRDVSDGEKEASGQIGAVLISRFTVRSSTDSRSFSPTDRIFYDGHPWNIQGIKEAAAEGRNRFLEITAIRDLDNGQADSSD